MPYIIHVHGKFFSMVDGDESDIRFEEVVRALMTGGYKGWISSEYEGPPLDDVLAVLQEHQAMLRRYQAKYLNGGQL